MAILVCLPAKLHINPFSLPNAEQEIYAGPMTEYAGPELAMWELSHGLEWVAATGLVATLVAPHIARLAWLAALHLCRALVCRRAAALGAGRRHGAPRHRLQRALLLAMHAHLRGSCHLVRALHEVPVMNILTMLWKNLRRGYQTLLFPARPKVTPRFRGLVQFDPALCTGCAVCRFRCTSRAIEFKAGKGEFTWSYNPGQCTFCGRCVEGCTEHALKEGHTEHALSQQQDTPADLSDQGELKKSYTVARTSARAQTAAASVAPVCQTGCTGGVQRRSWRRTMIALETIREKLGVAEPWVESRGTHWLNPGALSVREVAAVDERRAAPASSPSPPTSCPATRASASNITGTSTAACSAFPS